MPWVIDYAEINKKSYYLICRHSSGVLGLMSVAQTCIENWKTETLYALF